MDDIIIADDDLQQHRRNVRAFLLKCREQGVALNKDKFCFAQPEVTFAGFKVNQNGYTVDDDLLRAIRDFPEPKNRTDLRSSLGLVNQPLLTPISWRYTWNHFDIFSVTRTTFCGTTPTRNSLTPQELLSAKRQEFTASGLC